MAKFNIGLVHNDALIFAVHSHANRIVKLQCNKIICTDAIEKWIGVYEMLTQHAHPQWIDAKPKRKKKLRCFQSYINLIGSLTRRHFSNRFRYWSREFLLIHTNSPPHSFTDVKCVKINDTAPNMVYALIANLHRNLICYKWKCNVFYLWANLYGITMKLMQTHATKWLIYFE